MTDATYIYSWTGLEKVDINAIEDCLAIAGSLG
jgi:hypothetical protein